MRYQKSLFAFSLISASLFLPLACGTKNNPTTPTLPGGGPTPTFTSVIPEVTCPPNGLCGAFAVQREVDAPSTILNLAAAVSVAGSPVSTAGVTVVCPVEGAVPLTWATSSYTTTAPWTYVPGGVYTLNLHTSLGNASCAATAAGGITVSPNGQTTTWTNNGNYNIMEVVFGGSFVFLSLTDLNPPVDLPVTDFATPGTYQFLVECNQITAYSQGSTAIESQTSDELFTNVYVATYTPTITLTPTITPTFTITNTPTITYTPTNTPTPTFTSTPTPTFTPIHPFVAAWTTAGGSSSTFYAPWGIGVDSAGYVYVADNGNSRVVKLSSSGTYVTSWAGTGGEAMSYPHGLAVDSNNNVFVVDSGNNRVQEWTTVGGFTREWGSYGSGTTVMGKFDTPDGVAVDSSGDVYVVDTNNYRVQKFTGTGGSVTQWGSLGTGDGQFQNPLPVAVDASNYVYVGDTGASAVYSIQKFDSNGNFQLGWGSPSSLIPRGLMAYTDGNIYAMDNYQYAMVVFTSSGSLWGQLGSYGTGNGQFGNPPRGIAYGPNGDIYVCDSGNNRIEVFGP